MSDPAFERRLRSVFSRVFGIAIDQLPQTIDTETIQVWDSLVHLGLIAGLEKEFRVKISTSESISMLSEVEIRTALEQKLKN